MGESTLAKKTIIQRVLAGRKTLLIFILAILLPTLVIVYLSFNTFSQRRESVKALLESNLWISCQAALHSIENELLAHEKQILRPEVFSDDTKISSNNMGRYFILDKDLQIVFPKTAIPQSPLPLYQDESSGSQFQRAFQRAEFFEFSQKNYAKAAEQYRRSLKTSTSVQNSASALAGLGRSLLWARSYRNAHKVYTELNQKHGHLRNRSGHPYGILTAIQLYEIDLNQNQEENGLKILIDVYEKIRNGVWTLEFSAYDFFITEIKSILDSRLNDDRFLDIQEKYLTLQNKPSPYQEELQFIEYLKNEAVPHIKERRSLLGREEKAPHHRFLISSGNEYHLISYCELSSSQMLNRSYGGFSWDMDSIKTALLPKILDEVKKNSGLQIKLIDEEKKETPSADKETVLEKSLTLPFREFLLPWKILISQPAFDVLERTARRENFFYGVLIIVIVVLMLLGALLIVRDISRKSETARLKTEFVHNVSHELKTPLTLIRLYGETLQRKRNLTNTERHESYEIITKESERLSHMINNILDFSRIEMGKKIFDFKRGDLESVIRDTLESYRYHLEKKGFSIKEEITSGLPEISFDKEDMAGVLINLLSNAMKFSPEKKNVTVKLFKEKSMVVLQVADEGIGISPEDQSKIFERFYRSKHKIVNESKGSGLGLTLVKHIVDAHSGKIKIESEPGKGAVISICLPIPLSNKDKEK